MSTSSESISQQLSNLFSFPTLSRFNTFVSIRGFALLAFASYLLWGPVASQTDIIGAVVSISILILLALSAIITVLFGTSLRKKLSFKIFPPEAADPTDSALGETLEVSSDIPAVIVIRTSPFTVPPFFSVTLQLSLHSDEVRLHNFVLTGSSRRERVLVQKINFPHRGDWELIDIQAVFSDRLGLTTFRWKPSRDGLIQSFRVYPPRHSTLMPPVISSSNRAGDAISDIRERHGDPYDLKQHHPSDGMRKIAWKIFAKTGQLVARHPEFTMTPEGQTLLFCVADSQDDDVCAAALAYMKILEERELEVFFSCEGAGTNEIARTTDNAKRLLIETVWNTAESSSESIKQDLSNLLSLFRVSFADSNLRKVVIFCSERRLANAVGYAICKTLGEYLAAIKIEPIFCIVQSTSTSNTQVQAAESRTRVLELLKWICVDRDEREQELDFQLYRNFLNLCGLNNWQVIL